MNVKGAWKKGVTGKGVVITILDDGIEKIHDDLKDNYVSVILYALTLCIGETPNVNPPQLKNSCKSTLKT